LPPVASYHQLSEPISSGDEVFPEQDDDPWSEDEDNEDEENDVESLMKTLSEDDTKDQLERAMMTGGLSTKDMARALQLLGYQDVNSLGKKHVTGTFRKWDIWKFMSLKQTSHPKPKFLVKIEDERKQEIKKKEMEIKEIKEMLRREEVRKTEKERKEALKKKVKEETPKIQRSKRKCVAEKEEEVKIVSNIKEAMMELTDSESDPQSDDCWKPESEGWCRPKQKAKPKRKKNQKEAKRFKGTVLFQHDPDVNPFAREDDAKKVESVVTDHSPPLPVPTTEEEEFIGFDEEEVEEAERVLMQTSNNMNGLTWIHDIEGTGTGFGDIPTVYYGPRTEEKSKEETFLAAMEEAFEKMDSEDVEEAEVPKEAEATCANSGHASSSQAMEPPSSQAMEPPTKEESFIFSIVVKGNFVCSLSTDEIEMDVVDSMTEEEVDEYLESWDKAEDVVEVAVRVEQELFKKVFVAAREQEDKAEAVAAPTTVAAPERTRRLPRAAAAAPKSYAEADGSEDEEEDLLVPCIRCPVAHERGICPLKPEEEPHFIPNSKPSSNQQDAVTLPRAMATLPEDLSIRESRISEAEKGVWYKKSTRYRDKSSLEEGTIFGPYEGRLICTEDEADKSGTAWQVRLADGSKVYVDGRDDNEANWLKYVNCSRSLKEQNLVAFDFKGAIFYKVIQEILPGTELLVYYGDPYAHSLNINLRGDADHKPSPDRSDLYCCLTCQSYFRTEESLQRHKDEGSCLKKEVRKLMRGDLKEEREWECEQCEYRGTTKFNLDRHVGSCHSKEMKFHCQDCDYRTNVIQTFQVHRRTHTGEKPFTCSECSKSFSQKIHLTSHQLIHSEARPYMCGECPADFTCPNNLRRHQRTVHEQEANFKCETCGKRFASASGLTSHIRTHTGERPFKCPHCDSAFAGQSNRTSHLKRYHKDKL
jgi:DNA-directed RNA polymerase subunit RPC12/RpoP